MKNLTRQNFSTKIIRCINKYTFDYVDIEIPTNLRSVTCFPFFLKMAAEYGGFSTVDWEWGREDLEGTKPEFHYYAAINPDIRSDVGNLFIPRFPVECCIEIDLKTNKPINLDKVHISEKNFYEYIDSDFLIMSSLNYFLKNPEEPKYKLKDMVGTYVKK